MNEREFQDAIVDLAHMFDWRVFHARSAGTNKGWRTPVAYDGKGFPDLVLVHADRGQVIFAEIKAEKGRLSDSQREWGAAFQNMTGLCCYHIWYPHDSRQIGQELSFGRVKDWVL